MNPSSPHIKTDFKTTDMALKNDTLEVGTLNATSTDKQYERRFQGTQTLRLILLQRPMSMSSVLAVLALGQLKHWRVPPLVRLL